MNLKLSNLDMKELNYSEQKKVLGGAVSSYRTSGSSIQRLSIHSIMWYIGYAYGRTEGKPVGDLWLNFI